MPKRIPVMGRTPGAARPRPRECRPSAASRGYGREWRRIRLLQLGEQPFCEDCRDAGRVTAATEVDHVIPLARGGTHARDNRRSLCKPCHSRKTAERDGGLGRAKQQPGDADRE